MIDRRDRSMTRAHVIGAGPNGLAAAIVLARAGLEVDVFEAEEQPGGAVRTMALTLPGFLHDAGSAVYPLAAGSPFFNERPFRVLGLGWIHGDAAGWPIPRGGAQTITDALVTHLLNLGGSLHTSRRIDSVDEVAADGTLTLCDLTPKQMISIAGGYLSPGYRRTLQRFKYGPGVFKLDYALSGPVPWRAAACRRAITVHVGGTFAEIAWSEYEGARGRTPERPFILLAQPTLYDPSRAPESRHVLS